MMAISCLMIEALESFRQGLPKSARKDVFRDFFNNSKDFHELRELHIEFYEHIRCGLLHQAETAGGWKITRERKCPLFDSETKTINAFKFMKGIKNELENYTVELKENEWESQLWTNVKKKLKHICDQCKIEK